MNLLHVILGCLVSKTERFDAFLETLGQREMRRSIRRVPDLSRLRFYLSRIHLAFLSGSSQTRRVKYGVVKALLALHYATSSRTMLGELPGAQLWKFLTFIARRLAAMDSMVLANRMVRTLKGAAFHLRECGLQGKPAPVCYVGQVTPFRRNPQTAEYLLQLGMIGRALPRPPDSIADLAVEKQHDLLSKLSEPLDLDVDDSVENFLDQYHLKACKVIPCRPSLTSNSASYAYSRREGGRREELIELLRGNFELNLGDVPNDVYRVASTRVTEKLSRFGEFLAEQDFDMASRSVVIPELGWKTRVVSCSDPVRTQKSESYRRQLIKLLYRLRCCRIPLRDKTDVLRFPKRRSTTEHRVFSADLSSATDNLNHHVITAFCDALNIPFELVTGGTIDDCTINTGTLMGIPCSWPILSLAHAWACVELGIPVSSFYLKGDDLIGLWTADEIRVYTQGIESLTGMPCNLLKSFDAKDRGIFCERNYLRHGSTLVALKQIISVRFLCDTSPSEAGFPRPLRIRQRLWTMVGLVRYKLLVRMDRHWAGVLPRLSGLSYLPIGYGGLEVLPDRFGQKAPRLIARLASAIHDSTCPKSTIELLKFSWSKSKSAYSADWITERMMSIYDMWHHFHLGDKLPHMEAFLGNRRDIFGTWAHFISVPSPRVGFHRYYQVVKRLRKRLEKKNLPQHSRLRSWTVQGVRNLVNRITISDQHSQDVSAELLISVIKSGVPDLFLK